MNQALINALVLSIPLFILFIATIVEDLRK